MATIVTEDGTGLTTSNSYASEAELSTYATDRGVTVSGTAAVLLIQAMDYLEQQPFKGVKGSDDQALQWPRWGVDIDGYSVDTDAIPTILKEAQIEIALGVDGGDNPLAKEERSTKREKVGDIEVEYMDGARNYVYLKAADNKLRKLLTRGAFGAAAAAVRS